MEKSMNAPSGTIMQVGDSSSLSPLRDVGHRHEDSDKRWFKQGARYLGFLHCLSGGYAGNA